MNAEQRRLLTKIEQGSSEWFAARCHCVTASNTSKALSRLTRKSGNKNVGEPSATCDRYRIQVITETLTDIPVENYVSPAMDTGRELEPVAVAEYEFQTGLETDKTGFWVHPTIDRFGASPDRLVGQDGLLEVKCPLPTTHIEYLIAGIMPEEYVDQVQSELACTGRQWADFVSFCPVMPPDLKLFRIRVPRDEERIRQIEEGVVTFLEEVVAAIEQLRRNAVPVKPRDSEAEAYLTDEDLSILDRTAVE
jgi:predicted phage-related endonuclease